MLFCLLKGQMVMMGIKSERYQKQPFYNDGNSKLFYRPGPYKDFFFAFWVPVGSLLFFHSVGSLFGKIDFLFPAKKLDFINVVLGPYLTLTLGLWTSGLEEHLNFWIIFWGKEPQTMGAS